MFKVADKESLTAKNIILKEKLELALAQLNLNNAKRFEQQTKKTAKEIFNESEQHTPIHPLIIKKVN